MAPMNRFYILPYTMPEWEANVQHKEFGNHIFGNCVAWRVSDGNGKKKDVV